MAIKRIRNSLKRLRPQEVIPFEDWTDIEDRAHQAALFLKKGSKPVEILRAELKSAEEIVLTNRIHEVKEVRIIGDIQKIFTTDKTEQMNELVGQIKFIRGYLGEMQTWIDRKSSLEKLEADGKIIIRRSVEEEVLNERPKAS